MICRKIKDWEDEEYKKHSDVVWFGAYGKNVIKEQSKFQLNADATNATYVPLGTTTKGQYYRIKFSSPVDGYINFCDKNNIIFDGCYFKAGDNQVISGILPQEARLIINNYTSTYGYATGEVTFYEYSTSKFVDEAYGNQNVSDSYSSEIEAVKDSIEQKVSTLKKEIWHNVSFGMPIATKERNKLSVDSFIITVVESHPDVIRIEEFQSKIINKEYSCYMKIITKYGKLNFNI